MYPIPGYWYELPTELTELSGKGMKVVQKSQNCRVPVRSLYRSHRTFRVGYDVVQKSQTSSGYGYERHTPYPGTGTKFLQNSQNCQVRVKSGLNPGKYRGCARIFPGFRGRKTSEYMTYTPSGICHTNGPPHEGYHVVIA